MTSHIILQNVKFVTGKQADIVIENGIISELTQPNMAQGHLVVDCSGMYVSSGWIDLHVHAFSDHDPYGDKIDEIGVKQGVTTIVDAGSCGANQISELVVDAKQSKTNVFAFLNISEIGLQRVDELANLQWLNKGGIVKAVHDYPEFIVGLKARMSRSVIGKNGLLPLHVARMIADEVNLPIMVHIGTKPPLIEEIVTHLKKGDIITHYLNSKANGFLNRYELPKIELLREMNRGMYLDVGHGSASFSFEMAELAKKHDIHFDTISTDIYQDNRLYGPVYSLANTLTKFLSLGYSLPEVIHAVTKKPAHVIGRPELGEMHINTLANLTLFTLDQHPVVLEDATGEKRMSHEEISVQGVVINGEYFSARA